MTKRPMMAEKFDKHILKNGMVLLGEPMEAVASVAFGFMLPAGAALLPEGCCGAGGVIADWIFRGAGDKNSRQLGDALDGLGLARSRSVGSSHIAVGAALEAGNLAQALDLYADIVLKPSLEEDQFELARQLAVDGVLSLDDDPRQKVMLKLRGQFYPSPLGRSPVGEIAELKALTAQISKQIIKDNFNLSQTIFAVAGKYDFDAVCHQIEGLFEAEQQQVAEPVTLGSKAGKYTHIDNDGAQVHISLMTETVKPTDEDYYNARVAVSVLSGGMSARLFTKVREERRPVLCNRSTVSRTERCGWYNVLCGHDAGQSPGNARRDNPAIQQAGRWNQRRRNPKSQSWIGKLADSKQRIVQQSSRLNCKRLLYVRQGSRAG